MAPNVAVVASTDAPALGSSSLSPLTDGSVAGRVFSVSCSSGKRSRKPCVFCSPPHRCRPRVRRSRRCLRRPLDIMGSQHLPQPLLGDLKGCNGLGALLPSLFSRLLLSIETLRHLLLGDPLGYESQSLLSAIIAARGAVRRLGGSR